MKVSGRFTHEGIQGFSFGYHPFTRPKMIAHLYFVDGLLIDTGQRLMQKAILKEIGQLPVTQIFITHYHEDHSGNLDALQEQFACPIFASPKCIELMKAPPPISFAQRMVWGDRPAFTSIRPSVEVLKTPQYQFQLIPVPGHAPDMVVLYEPERKWLFSADLYVHHYIGYMLPEESIWEQIHSIRRVLELDFDILLCGHNPQLKNGKALLEKKLRFLEDFYRRVAELHQRNHWPQDIFKLLHLKENRAIKWLSGGQLSKINMVKSVVRDCTNRPPLPA
ncbi:MAG: MBL fold metallo-hydrolase [Bacteroidota bacterium]